MLSRGCWHLKPSDRYCLRRKLRQRVGQADSRGDGPAFLLDGKPARRPANNDAMLFDRLLLYRTRPRQMQRRNGKRVYREVLASRISWISESLSFPIFFGGLRRFHGNCYTSFQSQSNLNFSCPRDSSLVCCCHIFANTLRWRTVSTERNGLRSTASARCG